MLIAVSIILLWLVLYLKENGNPWHRKQSGLMERNEAITPTTKELEWIESFDTYLRKVDGLRAQGKQGHVELYYLMWAADGVIKHSESEFQTFKSLTFWSKYELFLKKAQDVIRYSNDSISLEEREKIMTVYGKHPHISTDNWTISRPH